MNNPTPTQTKPAQGAEIVNLPTTAQVPNVVANVSKNIRSYVEKRSLVLPQNYSAENALKSAWLMLQDVVNLDSKPIIKNGQLTGVVTEHSVANALLDMVIQGLNPSKKQCYFIVYGDKLTMQRSYFGEMALAKRIKPEIEFYSDVIREGDTFTTEKGWRNQVGYVTTVGKHEQAWPRKPGLTGAYIGTVDKETGEDMGILVMDIDRIKKSWGQSKTYKPDNSNCVHNKFPDEMALRTVTRRICKPIINSSDDALLLESVQRQEDDALEAEIEEEALEHANGEVLALGGAATTADAASEPDKPAHVEGVGF